MDEPRIPSFNFDTDQYLAANPDVAAAKIDPLRHFWPTARRKAVSRSRSELVTDNGFDYVYYLNHNPDVAAARVDPFQHFQTLGWQEGRNPNALFDTSGYLATYTDVGRRTPIRSIITNSRLARRPRSVGRLRHDVISGRLQRRERRAHQSAEALPP